MTAPFFNCQIWLSNPLKSLKLHPIIFEFFQAIEPYTFSATHLLIFPFYRRAMLLRGSVNLYVLKADLIDLKNSINFDGELLLTSFL